MIKFYSRYKVSKKYFDFILLCSMRRKICYIVNPFSGTSSKDTIENTIARETLKMSIPFLFFPSVANGDYGFLRKPIKDEKITDVIIVGGDGTVSQVVHSLLDMPIQFGIIPGGSGNGLAFGANIPKSPKKALDIIFHNHTTFIDGFRINGRFACMLCGLGFDAKVAHDFSKQAKRGLITYVNQIFKNFLDAKPYSFEITLKNSSFKTEAFFISIANSNQFGNHFKIAPKASLSDGLLDIVIITEQSKMALLYNTFMQAGGLNKLTSESQINKNRGIIYFQVDSIKIVNKSEALMHIDGEPVDTYKNIYATIEPQCFKLLTNNFEKERTNK